MSHDGQHNASQIKVLVIEPFLGDRQIFEKALQDLPDIILVKIAPSSSIGLIRAEELKPDLIILDCDVSDPNPCEFMKRLNERKWDMGVIVFFHGKKSMDKIARIIETLECGAFDFIDRELEKKEADSVAMIRRILLPKIRCFSIKQYSRIARGKSIRDDISAIKVKTPDLTQRNFQLLVIGASTGGPEALKRLLGSFPESLPVPVVIVLHMPENFTQSMANSLNRKVMIPVKEAEDGEPLFKGQVYLARGGKHLVIDWLPEGRHVLRYSSAPPVNNCRPSVDVLFDSAVRHFNNHVLAVLLTGMGNDGVAGMGTLKRKGSYTIAQDENSSLVWGMPGTAVKAGNVDMVLSLDEIASFILKVL